MKHLFTLLALTIGFSMNAQWSSGTGTDAIETANATASGSYSTAMGIYTTASGSYSTAMGYGTTASVYSSTAMGRGTEASGISSTAMGKGTTAIGDNSTAMGYYTTASDFGSLVIGQFNYAGSSETTIGASAGTFSLANTAFVIGNGTGLGDNPYKDAFKVMFNGNTTASGSVTATEFIGNGSQLTNLPFSLNDTSGNGIQSNTNTASGGFSTAMGRSTIASANYSTAMGYRTKASDFGSFVIGQYNSSGSTPTSADSFNTANTAFVIGNGTIDVAKDAFKVLFNGDTTVSNDLTVNGNVMISSDARLKANIVSLGATLAKLLLIDGKSYTMKKDGKQKIGVLAQDIQKVFPELVSTDDRDMLAVNYQGLVPVLINALKEQQADIDELKEQGAKMIEQDSKLKEQGAKMIEQEKRLERLEAIISKMDK